MKPASKSADSSPPSSVPVAEPGTPATVVETPAPVAVPPAPPEAPRVLIKNTRNHMVSLQILDKSGRVRAVELSAKASLEWPQMPSYGPNVDSKLRHRYLSISPVIPT